MANSTSIPRIATAGWTLPKQHVAHFRASTEEKLSHLERYAGTLNCVEINSSFHRPHQRKTWERWAASTPANFRFAVKIPKAITHTAKLVNCGAMLQQFLDEATGLGSKLGPLLVQLPPSLAFDEGLAREFFTTLRELHPQSETLQSPPPKAARSSNVESAREVALEARHASWFAPSVHRLLRDFQIARVAADPPKCSPLAANPGGWPGLRYYRLHGSPRTYYSDYSEAFLTNLAKILRKDHHSNTWIIFDNTALGHATANALTLQSLMRNPPTNNGR